MASCRTHVEPFLCSHTMCNSCARPGLFGLCSSGQFFCFRLVWFVQFLCLYLHPSPCRCGHACLVHVTLVWYRFFFLFCTPFHRLSLSSPTPPLLVWAKFRVFSSLFTHAQHYVILWFENNMTNIANFKTKLTETWTVSFFLYLPLVVLIVFFSEQITRCCRYWVGYHYHVLLVQSCSIDR